MKKKHFICSCHKWNDPYGERYGCLITCRKCSGAKEVKTTEREGYKKIEVSF